MSHTTPTTSLLWRKATAIPHQMIKNNPAILTDHGGKLVRIWSGQHGFYWGPNCGGYVGFDTAGIYRLDAAWAATSHCGPEKMVEYRPAIYAAERDQERFNTATDEPLALLQWRRWIVIDEPSGVIHDGEGWVYEDLHPDDRTSLNFADFLELDSESVIEWWETERVFLNQAEAKEWGEARKHRWPDGWRVYSVPCRGKLRALVASGPEAAKVYRGES